MTITFSNGVLSVVDHIEPVTGEFLAALNREHDFGIHELEIVRCEVRDVNSVHIGVREVRILGNLNPYAQSDSSRVQNSQAFTVEAPELLETPKVSGLNFPRSEVIIQGVRGVQKITGRKVTVRDCRHVTAIEADHDLLIERCTGVSDVIAEHYVVIQYSEEVSGVLGNNVTIVKCKVVSDVEAISVVNGGRPQVCISGCTPVLDVKAGFLEIVGNKEVKEATCNNLNNARK